MSDFAIVTGGAGSIGTAIAERLTNDGFRVVTVDRDEPRHSFLSDHVSLDLADATATSETLGAFCRDRRVTRLVNGAGIVRPARFDDTTAEDFDLVQQVNVRSAMLAAQAAVPSMRRAGIGRIVSISSRAALGKELRTAYSASKAALLGMTKTMALELARDGITVNAIGPGPTGPSCSRRRTRRIRPRPRRLSKASRLASSGSRPTSPMPSPTSSRMPRASSPARRFMSAAG
ncbi:SDR family NAD(P)-dependent oxidoreductase [Bosea sp. BK604]|uniref:SDR family NAD(P)-dependent oxidoreductase n=1 Tax=Bosea sp. BK604 TaxID=2512180 RepID=UPI0010DF044F|nr:SDR family NAD(P)-dependent oxidoreductase [Bosea sp. BK604]TCR61784.1 NAD(P)-dependent dehydrogenase (short-subunit alcohol dehydrogenase family) [Bosea sp. BK604]